MSKRDTKAELLKHGTQLFLERGYSDTGLKDILSAAGVPKGSFYHHFSNKMDFGLQAVQRYSQETRDTLDSFLSDQSHPPIDRLRMFFEAVFAGWAQRDCREGCLLGVLGQELADVHEDFRLNILGTLDQWAARIAICLAEAQGRDELSPEVNVHQLAGLLVDGFQGAALRMRLVRNEGPLEAFLSHYFDDILNKVDKT